MTARNRTRFRLTALESGTTGRGDEIPKGEVARIRVYKPSRRLRNVLIEDWPGRPQALQRGVDESLLR